MTFLKLFLIEVLSNDRYIVKRSILDKAFRGKLESAIEFLKELVKSK